jgi:hypothetical protein
MVGLSGYNLTTGRLQLGDNPPENGLRHILRVAVTGGAAAGDGINQAKVPTHQFGERRLRMMARIFPHQIHAQRIGHQLIIPADGESGQIISMFFGPFQFLDARRENPAVHSGRHARASLFNGK